LGSSGLRSEMAKYVFGLRIPFSADLKIKNESGTKSVNFS
jgi:hypothetical protein